MPRSLRSALLALVTVLAVSPAPARAADPTVLVSATANGGLVKVTLYGGHLGLVTELVKPAGGAFLVPMQANGASVSYVAETERGRATAYDVGVVNADTGKRSLVTKDGRSGHLLVSRDGRFHYILTTNSEGTLMSLVRTDARGGHRRTLVAGPTGRAAANATVQLSGSGISPDGRSIYVARTPGDDPSTLYAVDTTTGAKRVITFGSGTKYILNVVASPDGKTLAVSYLTDDEADGITVALVNVKGGLIRTFTTYGQVLGSAFTADGSGLVLSLWGYLGVTYDPEGGVGPTEFGLSLGDVANGTVTQIEGTDNLFQAVVVS